MCRVQHVPGDKAGSRQVSEGVDHGDHQRDYDNTGVYDVQLGAEINSEPKKIGVKSRHEAV